jgi:competence protein ComEC
MIGIMFIGTLFRRRASSFNSLGLAAIIILLMDPSQLFRPGFQLSFAAVFSILHSSPKLAGILRLEGHSKASSYIGGLFSVSLAAWLGVSGLVAYHFDVISPIAIFGNLIVIPLAFLIIASSISFVTFSFLARPLAPIFAAATEGQIQLLNLTVNKLSILPFSYFKIEGLSAGIVIAYYAFLLVIFNYKALRSKTVLTH